MIDSNLIKSIQDIMRKDAGVDGDAQRISQMAWMIFLKIFDDKEKETYSYLDHLLVFRSYSKPCHFQIRIAKGNMISIFRSKSERRGGADVRRLVSTWR